jgi:hypothetical protein
MPAFTFEIIRRDETPVVVNVLPLSGSLAIWCQVEALALLIEHSDGVHIRVKNPKGETVIRTGVATALASIEKCSCAICPLKKEAAGRSARGGQTAIAAVATIVRLATWLCQHIEQRDLASIERPITVRCRVQKHATRKTSLTEVIR